nr:PREDICTED: cGMP-dependent 3',5'-cyclic phosphodiesterase-like isoform X1 [Linepithema humile]
MSSSNLVSDPQRILSLIEELCDLSYTEVQRRLNKYVQNATNAKLVFLISMLVNSKEMVIHVIGETILDTELRFPISNNVLYEAVITKTSLILSVAKLDEKLLRYINRITDVTSKSLLIIPIQHPFKHYTAFLVCLVDYKEEDKARHACTEIVQECFRFCIGYLLNFHCSLCCCNKSRMKQQCQNLLTISKKLFTHLGDLSDHLCEIMAEAKKLINAEKCSLFLLDPARQTLVAKVLNDISTKDNPNEIRISIKQGVAGYVATTGKLLNVQDAYNNFFFYRGIDDVTGFKTKNILCFPIWGDNGVVGVGQLCNKINASSFDAFDEQIATAFSIYCGTSIMYNKKMQDAEARNELSNEIMMYHMKVEESDVQELLNCKDDHNIKDFDEFHFSPKNVPYEHMPCYIIKMFTDLNFLNHWRIEKSTLARFILYVKKNYRDASYHNWTHAFSVTHFAYLLIKNVQLVEENYMTPLQALVLFVSCLCHDIDHRGTNNSFQIKSGTALASLYSSEGSVMERHHFAQTMCILNIKSCNIFESLNSNERDEALDLLKSNILATDLVSHLDSVTKLKEMIRHKYNKDDSNQQKLLFAMLMTCCDLSDQTKDWKVSKKTARQIYDEFFSQGDLEKSMGNAPIEMMDRKRAFIFDIQIKFITDIVIPVFTNLSLLFPSTQSLVHALKHNLSLWELAKSVFQNYSTNKTKDLDILFDLNFEDEVLKVFAQRN